MEGTRATFTLVAGRAAAFAVTFALPLLLVRMLDPTEFGTYKQLFLIFSTVYALVPLGMGESLFYFVPRAGEGSGRYVANALLWLTGSAVLAAAALAAAAGPIGRALSNPALTQPLPAFA